jgi:hypothetical protein
MRTVGLIRSVRFQKPPMVRSGPLTCGGKRPRTLDLGLLGHLKGIVDLDAQVSHGTLELAVSHKQLDRAKVLRGPVDKGCLCPSHGMCAVGVTVKTNLVYPAMNNPPVLTRAEMSAGPSSAGKDVVLRPERAVPNPVQQRLPGPLGHFELHRPLGLLLHDDCPTQYVTRVAQILDAERDQIASAQLTIDRQIKQGQVAMSRPGIPGDSIS